VIIFYDIGGKMDKNTFELLAKYNREVNQQMNNIINMLSEEEWNKKFSGYFKSIHELCSHIFIADYRKFKDFKSVCSIENFNDTYFSEEHTYKETLFDSINEYITKRAELDNIIVDFIKKMAPADLTKNIKIITSTGGTIEKKLELFLMTIFNHETHHRGMVSLYLEMLGKENDYSRFVSYV
jgi:uncharacterized damage-inducible protein DinB